MSGNTPPNPGTPRKNPHAPNPSMLARIGPGKIITAGALAIASYLYLAKPPAPRDDMPVSFRTPGVKNIEKAYTNAGATPTHTKAYGGTPQGDKSSVHLRDGEGQAGTGTPTKDSPFKQEGMGDEQRPWIPSKAGEVFDQTMVGSAKGK